MQCVCNNLKQGPKAPTMTQKQGSCAFRHRSGIYCHSTHHRALMLAGYGMHFWGYVEAFPTCTDNHFKLAQKGGTTSTTPKGFGEFWEHGHTCLQEFLKQPLALHRKLLKFAGINNGYSTPTPRLLWTSARNGLTQTSFWNWLSQNDLRMETKAQLLLGSLFKS